MVISVGSLFTLIVVLLAVGLLIALAFYVLREIGPPDPMNRIIRVVIVVIGVLIIVSVLLSMTGVIGPISVSR
jgi:hypothetical protein